MLRDALIEENISVQAPCIWQNNCPALASGAECYAQREMEKPYLIKELQRAAEINLSSLKMSYTIYRSLKAEKPSYDGLNIYRVISPAIETFRGKRYFLCGVGGKKSLGSHLAEQGKSSRAFDFLKRGDVLEVEEALENKNQIDLVEQSKLTIFAACGKPVMNAQKENEESW